jgi:hypothetical protein
LEVGGDDSSKWPVPGDPVNPVSHLQKKADDIGRKEWRLSTDSMSLCSCDSGKQAITYLLRNFAEN